MLWTIQDDGKGCDDENVLQNTDRKTVLLGSDWEKTEDKFQCKRFGMEVQNT